MHGARVPYGTRLFRVLRGGGIGWPGTVCHRIGDMGFDCFAVNALRRDWPSTHIRPRQSRRRHGPELVDGQNRANLPNG